MDKNIESIVHEHHTGAVGFTRHYLTLYSLVLGMEAQNVFELGAGFSSPTILAALKKTGGKLTTCDNRSVEHKQLTGVMEEYKDRWTYHQAESRDFLKTISNEVYDVVLHDGAHDFKNIILDLWKIAPRVKKNGLILVHDTFHPGLQRRSLSLAVRIGLFPRRYEIVTLPYGNGLSIIRMKSNAHLGTFVPKWSKSTATEMNS